MSMLEKMDLRKALFQLYLKNNPKLEHQIFIYSYHGVVDVQTNPFHFVGGALPANVKKSIVLQNIPTGEMIQAFIVPKKDENGKTMFQIDNVVLYGNKTGTLIEIHLEGDKINKTEKYRQFQQLVHSILYQFL